MWEEERLVEGRIEHPLVGFCAALYLDVAEDVVPRLAGILANGFEALACQFCLEVSLRVFDADERETYLDFQRLGALWILQLHHSDGTSKVPAPAVVPHPAAFFRAWSALFRHALNLFRQFGIEVDATFAVLKALESILASLLQFPSARIVVRAGNVDEHTTVVALAESVAMVAATQRRRQFHIHIISF